MRTSQIIHTALLATAFLNLTPATLQAAATIVIVNGDPADVGFNDSAEAAPVGGNTGTTLGQQRLNAFQAAADRWGAALNSSIVIRISATWTALSCTANSGTLGTAGPAQVWKDYPGAAVSSRWYPKALANRLSNTDMYPSSPDITATFNVNLGKPGCLTGTPFYLGLDNQPAGKIDLVAVVEHEFAHGLGFHTSTNRRTGALLEGAPGIADDYLTDTTTGKNWSSMSADERAASATKTGRLVWTGGNVTYALPSVLRQSGSTLAGTDALSRVMLYAPNQYDSGSSVVHWDPSAAPYQLMEPQYNNEATHEIAPPGDLTLPMLHDIGWGNGPTPLPRLELAASHASDFTQGQTGTQTIQVSNTGNAPTVGQVSALISAPAGLTATSMEGSGWTCTLAAVTCSRSDALAAGSTYPSITASLKAGSSAPAQVSSGVGAWGGGSLPAAATDEIAITAAPGGGIAADGTTQKILPQLAFGSGWYTALYFTNTTTSPVSFSMNFIDNAGAALPVGSIGSSTTVTIAARGTTMIEALDQAGLKEGYVSVSLPPGVVGYGVFRQSAAGGGAQEAVVPLSGVSSTSSTLIWDDTADFITAVSIVNPTASATTVTVTVRDTNGVEIATSSLALPANGKTARALRQLTNLAGIVGRRGSAEFTVSSGAIAVLGLRFKAAAFTSIPTSDR